jgi:hypothetical protein
LVNGDQVKVVVKGKEVTVTENNPLEVSHHAA